ncbi:hypothetical protein PENTCL1PPCAC_27250, partial [Pristionchus entomophagus]
TMDSISSFPSTSSDFSIDRLLSSSSQSSSPSSLPMQINPLLWSSNPLFLFNTMMNAVPRMVVSSYAMGRRKRRHRTIFSEEQLSLLEHTFHSTQYPDVSIRERLAIQCSLKEERVEVWFKNRRAKERKRRKEDKNDGTKRREK